VGVEYQNWRRYATGPFTSPGTVDKPP
jgi:hypothetical protein